MEHFKNLFNNAVEIPNSVLGRVSGNIPDWLQGSFVRTGPGKFDFSGDFTMGNWYDGYAILTKLVIGKGQVTFSSRFLQSDAYKKALSSNRPQYAEFGTRAYPEKRKALFSKFMTSLNPSEITDNAAMCIYTIGDEVYAATETCHVRRFDPSTLECKEKYDFYKIIGINFMSPHVLHDEETGCTYALGVSILKHSYVVFQIPTKSGTKGTKCISVSKWNYRYSYQHSFSSSASHLILIEQPFVVNTLLLLSSQLKGRCFRDCLEWLPDEKVIVPRAETLMTFRRIISTSYRRRMDARIQFVAYENPKVMDVFKLTTLRCTSWTAITECSLLRFALPLLNGVSPQPSKNLVQNISGASACLEGSDVVCKPVDLGCDGMEYPVINGKYRGKAYRYVYGSGVYDTKNLPNSVSDVSARGENFTSLQLAKVDLQTGTRKLWRESEFLFPGEPVFVEKPNSRAEDDGIVMSAVTDARHGMPSFLLILDAANFAELARAIVPVHIPQAVHGIFLPETE